MKIVLQRVLEASVTVDTNVVSSIGHGLLVLLGVEEGDQEQDAAFLAQKIAGLRIFADLQEKMNLSVKEVEGSILVVSQFTLLADWRKGNRPSFIKAAKPEDGERLYLYFCDCLRKQNITVQTGIFAAHMKVALVNDGPVTIIMENQVASHTKMSGA
jgi:D-tyrosyl-tRNA(Tyr) deacylase